MPDTPSRKLAVILHADVAGSTSLVQKNESVAHDRIRAVFQRLARAIREYGGVVHELRGDALVGEFERASDAISAALAFQDGNANYNAALDDDIRPQMRIGISIGEVVFADRTVTGAGVVLAQRLEQLAEPGGVCIQGAAHETVPARLPFAYRSLGEQELKGFAEAIRAYAVSLKPGESIPAPEPRARPILRWMLGGTVAVVALVLGGLAWWQPWLPKAEPASTGHMAFPLPERPSITVLPFTNLGNDPAQEYFSDAFTEDLITNLSLYRELFVISRSSSFVYKGEALDVKRVARELGVQFVLEGSVMRQGPALRISAKLVDALKGDHVWAERFDRDASEVFGVLDEIARLIAGRIAPELMQARLSQSYRKPTDDLNAWDLYLRARAAEGFFSRESQEEAERLARSAIERDPNLAAAHVVIAESYLKRFFYGWMEDRPQALARGIEHAAAAVALDARKAEAYRTLGRAYRFAGDETQALGNLRRAVELNPNDASAHRHLAHALDWFRHQREGLTHIREAIRLSPRDPEMRVFHFLEAHMLYHLGEHEEALKASERMAGVLTGDVWTSWYHSIRAASLAQLGRSGDARIEIEKALQARPELSLSATRAQFQRAKAHPKNIEGWLDGLRKAGLPE